MIKEPLWLIPAFIALAIMALGIRALIRRNAAPFGLPPAKPGLWYGDYHAAWTAAHPGAWERGESSCGSFYKGDNWGTATLEFDQQWFKSRGMGLPRNCFHVSGKAEPGSIRIASVLGPGESVSLPIIAAPSHRRPSRGPEKH